MPETQGSSSTPTRAASGHILDRIVATKRVEVEALRSRAAELRARSADAPPPRSFAEALSGGSSIALIAEVKRRSPGAGAIRPDLDPVELALRYEVHGAAALSVLTDREYFGGSLDDLVRIRERAGIPILRKDFTIDPLQILEARAGGADAILLIVRILGDVLLQELLGVAASQGLAALVEVHDERELERAVAAGARLVGVNNRDLATFRTTLETTERLAPALPADRILVSESGIRSRSDVERLAGAGIGAILVGESLLREADPGAAARALAGVPRRTRAG